MSQQINLLNKEFRPKRELLDAALMLKVSVGFALLLGAYAGYISQEARKLATQRAEWIQRAQESQARIMHAVKQAPTPEDARAVQMEIATIEKDIQSREQVLSVLKSGDVGENKGNGFSGMLQAFARQSLNGIWLTGITTNGTGDQMRISGRAISPDLIAQYISRLSNEQVLHGHTFEAFEVSQPRQGQDTKGIRSAMDGQNSYIEFTLSSGKSLAPTNSTEKAAEKAAVKS